MNISINARPADITLDTEKTLGEVLSGIEMWVSSTGNRLQRVSIDGKELEDDSLSAAFDTDLNEIKKLDILVSSYRELAEEAIAVLLTTAELFIHADFDQRQEIADTWQKSPAANFLLTDISDLHQLAALTFSGQGMPAGDLAVFAEERLREISTPGDEIAANEELVKSITARMEELPLDMQTGKDQRAAETIQLFSRVAEKLFRVFFIFKAEGLCLDSFTVDELPSRTFMEEFTAALTEISAAYENKDTVLIGDLSEYELAPRMLKFFFALKNFSQTIAAANSVS